MTVNPYIDAINAEPGITTVALAERFGKPRDSITRVLIKALLDKRVERTNAARGDRVRWYPYGQTPAVRSAQATKRALYVAHIKANPGISTKTLAAHFKIDTDTATRILGPAVVAKEVERRPLGPNLPAVWIPAGCEVDTSSIAEAIRAPKNADRLADVLKAVSDAGKAGITALQIGAKVGKCETVTERRIRALQGQGKIVRREGPPTGRGRAPSLWFLTELAPREEIVQKPVKPKTVTLDACVDAIIPANVKVTRAPTPRGRFDFAPEPGWRGQITSDWLERVRAT